MDLANSTIMNYWFFRIKFRNRSIFEWVQVLNAICIAYGLKSALILIWTPIPSSRVTLIWYLRLVFYLFGILIQLYVVLTMKWSNFSDCIYHSDLIYAHANSAKLSEIRKKRRNKFLLILFLELSYQCLMLTPNKFLSIVDLVIFLTVRWFQFGLFAVLIDTSVCLEILFRTISSSISKLRRTKPSNVASLFIYRKVYNYSFRATVSAESFFRNLITLNYLRNFGDIILIIYQILVGNKSMEPLLFFTGLTIITILVSIQMTFQLNDVYVSSQISTEFLYDISLITDRNNILIHDQVICCSFDQFNFLKFFFFSFT